MNVTQSYENGHDSWNALLAADALIRGVMRRRTIYIYDINDCFLNSWFATYQEAKDYQSKQGLAFYFHIKILLCLTPNYIGVWR